MLVTIAAYQAPSFRKGGTRQLSGTCTVENASAVVLGSFPSSISGLIGFRIQLGGVDYTVGSCAPGFMILTESYTGASGTAPYVVYPYIFLQFYAQQTFTSSVTHEIIQQSAVGGGAWYRQIACGIVGDTIYVPELQLDSTTDAVSPSEQGARWAAVFYSVSGTELAEFQPTPFRLDPRPNPTDWAKIAAFNASPSQLPPNYDTYTKHQINELVVSTGPVPGARRIDTAEGIEGGGDLTQDRVFKLTDVIDEGSAVNASIHWNSKGQITNATDGTAGSGDVPGSRLLTASGGLIGGGDLTADRDFSIEDVVDPGVAINAVVHWNSKGQIIYGADGEAGTGTGPSNPIFTLEQFGAVADNATDCLPAFNAFLAYLEAHGWRGATLQLAPGQYYSSGPWRHNYSLNIVGSGSSLANTGVRFGNNTVGVIHLQTGEGTGPNAQGATYTNFRIDGSESVGPGWDGTCNTAGNILTRVTGPPFTSIWLNGCTVTVANESDYGFDWSFSVVDDDHLQIVGADLLVQGNGTSGVGRLSNYEWASYLAGGTDIFHRQGGAGIGVFGNWSVTAVHDIGNITVSPDHGISGAFYAYIDGYLGTHTGVHYRLNYRHGFEIHSRAILKNVTINGFHGMGICSDSARPAINPCNQNLFEYHKVWVNGCRGHGLYTYGNDANAGQVYGFSASGNWGVGILEQSFLGNTYIGCHTEFNALGGYWMGSNAQNKTVVDSCYAEDDQMGIIAANGVIIIGGVHDRIHPYTQTSYLGWLFGHFLNSTLGIRTGGGLQSRSAPNAAFGLNMIQDTGTIIEISGPGSDSIPYPVVVQGPLYLNGKLNPSAHIVIKSMAGNPTGANLPGDCWDIFRNTTTGTVALWVNDGGTLKQVVIT